jgi:hypothetical protein
VKAGGFRAKCSPFVHVGELQPQKGAQAAIILNLTTILARVGWEASDEIEDTSIERVAKQRKLGTNGKTRSRLKRPSGAAMLSRSQITRSGIAE